MSKVERNHRQRRRMDSPSRPHFVRLVASGCAALVLMSGAYQAAFATHTPETADNPNDGSQPFPPLPDYGEDDGIGTTEGVAIGVGVAAGLAAAAGAFGGAGILGLAGLGRDGCPQGQLLPNGDARILPPLPANAEVVELCLAPENTRVDSGVCRVFDLRAKNREDRRWYSVTGRAESMIEIRDPQQAGGAVVKLEGSKNTFCVPITAPQSANGRSVVIVGTFAPAGAKPMSAEARLLVRTPGRAAPPAAPPAR